MAYPYMPIDVIPVPRAVDYFDIYLAGAWIGSRRGRWYARSYALSCIPGDNICACGKQKMDGVRCIFGGTHLGLDHTAHVVAYREAVRATHVRD